MADFCQFLMIFQGIHQYWASVHVGVGGKGTEVGWVVANAKIKQQDDTNGRV